MGSPHHVPQPPLNLNSQMKPLPSDAAEHYGLNPEAARAYSVCQNFEQHTTNDISAIHARILGYLIIHSPSDAAQKEVVKVIHSCHNDYVSLSALGSMFLEYYICPCW